MSSPVASVVFKCSFGGLDGWGHVIRSAALASAFQRRGWQTVLWSESDCLQLPAEARAAFDVHRSGPLDRSWAAASALFVDEMYTGDAELEELGAQWRGLGGCRVLAGTDDMQKRRMAAMDVVVNAEVGLREASYESRLSLLGESYALLRKGFAPPHGQVADWEVGDDVPVFVMMGGTDAFGYLPRVLSDLLAERSFRYAPVLPRARRSGSDAAAMKLLGEFTHFKCLEGLGSVELAAWMRRCRVAVIACGSSLYELAAAGVPFVGLSLVDNQTASARKVETLWKMPIVYRENRHEDPLRVREPLGRLLEGRVSSFGCIDGLGADRVADVIISLAR